jgi:hypothetical protein
MRPPIIAPVAQRHEQASQRSADLAASGGVDLLHDEPLYTISDDLAAAFADPSVLEIAWKYITHALWRVEYHLNR